MKCQGRLNFDSLTFEEQYYIKVMLEKRCNKLSKDNPLKKDLLEIIKKLENV